MEDLAEKQAKEQEMKQRFRKSVFRQNELKLMKHARKSLGQSIVDNENRQIVKDIIKIFLSLDYPFEAVSCLISFLPVFGWEDDLDAYKGTMYLTIYDPKHEGGDALCVNKPMTMTQEWGPNDGPIWSSADQDELTRHTLLFHDNFGRFESFKCVKGITPNQAIEFKGDYRRKYYQRKEHENVKVILSNQELQFKTKKNGKISESVFDASTREYFERISARADSTECPNTNTLQERQRISPPNINLGRSQDEMYARLNYLFDMWFGEEIADEVTMKSLKGMIMLWADSMIEFKGLCDFENDGEREDWWRSACDRLSLKKSERNPNTNALQERQRITLDTVLNIYE